MVAGQVIEEAAGSKIRDGDVILTYARYTFISTALHFLLLTSRIDRQLLKRCCSEPIQKDVNSLSSLSIQDPCWKVGIVCVI